jgi:membrane-bound lytic murein transglycosylase A
MAELTYKILSFEDLHGWADDDHRAALDAFCVSCGDGPAAELAIQATAATVARGFFEQNFHPVLVEDGSAMLFTGYFEPEIAAALNPDETYRYPIYATPQDGSKATAPRRTIDEGCLTNLGLEIAWLSDPVDVFFLQVQGSGRLRLQDGTMMRVGFGAKNGHPYTSIGKVLVARGIFTAETVTADAIRAWVHENPTAGRALLWENESYVFFRQIDDVPSDQGPLGAMGHSVSAGRTIAVDPDITPLGLPVWIEKTGDAPMQRLMVAQDTGSAIKGAQRADIFFGTGDDAGKRAGQIKDGGRMVILMPNAMADDLHKGVS